MHVNHRLELLRERADGCGLLTAQGGRFAITWAETSRAVRDEARIVRLNIVSANLQSFFRSSNEKRREIGT